tara:strand:+ start:444 stop:635 length:192 start_codon:yes stop_codon:yes gene_type:complete
MAIKRAGNSQGLSPVALRRKRARDKAAAMTPKRRKRKAENQHTAKGQIPTSTMNQTEYCEEPL